MGLHIPAFYLIYTIMYDLRRYFFRGREKIESCLLLLLYLYSLIALLLRYKKDKQC